MNTNVVKFLIIILVCIGLIKGYTLYKNSSVQKKVHYHAGFAVFSNDKRMDFSDPKYMFVKPCSVNEKDESGKEDDQLEKAHLHDNIGDVIHIEKDGAVWKDLFTNIRFAIDYQKTIGYINNKKIANYETYSIKPDDTLVVFIGENNIVKDLTLAPSKEYVSKIAKKSVTCGE